MHNAYDWRISGSGGTVYGPQEYIEAMARFLDACEPPVPYRIFPPFPRTAQD